MLVHESKIQALFHQIVKCMKNSNSHQQRMNANVKWTLLLHFVVGEQTNYDQLLSN